MSLHPLRLLRRLALAGTLAALGALAAGCGAGAAGIHAAAPAATPSAGGAPAPPPPVAVRIAYPSDGASYLPFYAAVSQGFFRKDGVDATMVKLSFAASVAALHGGEVSFDTLPGDDIVANLRGIPTVTLYSTWDQAPWSIAGSTSIGSLADLRGRVLGVNAVASSNMVYVRAALRKAGLTLGDVSLVQFGGTENIYAALLAGKVDAGIVSPPFDLEAARNRSLHIVAHIGGDANLPYVGLATTPKLLRADPQAVVHTIEALIQGEDWMRAHPHAAAALLVQKTHISQSLAASAVAEFEPLLARTGRLPAGAVRAQLRFAKDTLHMKVSGVNPKVLVDYGPLRQAEAALGR